MWLPAFYTSPARLAGCAVWNGRLRTAPSFLREMMKLLIAAAAIFAVVLSTCSNDADVASHNISTAADNFQVERRIVFFNGITDKYLLEIEGLCSLGNNDKPRELSVTCKTGPSSYKKHFLGLSDNVSYFVEQVDASNVSAYHYKVTFKPEAIVPDIQVR